MNRLRLPASMPPSSRLLSRWVHVGISLCVSLLPEAGDLQAVRTFRIDRRELLANVARQIEPRILLPLPLDLEPADDGVLGAAQHLLHLGIEFVVFAGGGLEFVATSERGFELRIAEHFHRREFERGMAP